MAASKSPKQIVACECGWEGRRRPEVAALPCPRCQKPVQTRQPRKYAPGRIGEEGSKSCARCKQDKPYSEYGRRGRDNDLLDSYCKDCKRANTDSWRANRANMAKVRLRVRQRVIAHYGGRCACCGEYRLQFLALDHENGGGSAHRRAIGRKGTGFYTWIITQRFPPGYRVLCHNCNLAIGFYGRCPHEYERARSRNVTRIELGMAAQCEPLFAM